MIRNDSFVAGRVINGAFRSLMYHPFSSIASDFVSLWFSYPDKDNIVSCHSLVHLMWTKQINFSQPKNNAPTGRHCTIISEQQGMQSSSQLLTTAVYQCYRILHNNAHTLGSNSKADTGPHGTCLFCVHWCESFTDNIDNNQIDRIHFTRTHTWNKMSQITIQFGFNTKEVFCHSFTWPSTDFG